MGDSGGSIPLFRFRRRLSRCDLARFHVRRAESPKIAPKPAAMFQRTCEDERSPPLSVTLNGRTS
jgi:hypothetical protein